MRYTYYDEFDKCKEDSTTDKSTNIENESPSNTRHRPENLSTFPPQAEFPTKTLLRATSSTPAITVTRYGSVPSPKFTYTHLPQMSVAQPEPLQSTVQRRESVTIMHAELDKYFEALKREFEDKTGRMWVALEPVKDEEWGWESELTIDEVDDEESELVFDGGKDEESDDAVEDMNDDTVELAMDWFLKGGDFGLGDANLDLDDFKWNVEGDDTLSEHAGERRSESHLERTTVRV